MCQTTKRFAVFLATWVLAATVHAQGQSPSDAQPPSATADDVPKIAAVHDPMLEPVPPPAHTLATWQDALRLVRQRSTALHISAAEVTQAEGAERRALSRALPTLTGNGLLTRYLLLGTGVNGGDVVPDPAGGPPIVTGVTTGSLPDPATRLSASLDLRVPVFDLASWYGVGTAKERTRTASLNQSDTQRQLLAMVAQSVVSVITTTRASESSRVSLASAISTRDLTKKRFELGAASGVDVLRAEQEVALSRSQLVTIDEQLRQARETLGAALGYSTGWGVSPDMKLDELQRAASQVCKVVGDVNARSDIEAAASSVKAAERDRTSVDYTFSPTVDLFSSFSYLNSTASPNGKHENWTVGGQLVWPIYDGGDRYGLRRMNEAEVVIAKEQLTQKRRDATLQIVQADRGVIVAQTNFKVATVNRDLAKEGARLARLAFVNGSGTSFDLVDNTRKLREAEIDLLIKDFQVFQAKLTAFLSRSNCSV